MWKARHGTWTSAPAAPAGRDASCATLKCVPRLSARRPSGTRTPVATRVQVIGEKDRRGPRRGRKFCCWLDKQKRFSDVLDSSVWKAGSLQQLYVRHADSQRNQPRPVGVDTGIVQAAHAGRVFRTQQTWNGKNVPDFAPGSRNEPRQPASRRMQTHTDTSFTSIFKHT